MRGRTLAVAALVFTATLATAATATAQPASALAPAVREYVAVAGPTVVLRGVTLIDGSGGPAVPDQTIVISGTRILQVGPTDGVAIPAGAEVLDLRGHTVIPGIIGLHNHLFYTPAGRIRQLPYSGPRLYLGSGVTTIRTTGSFQPYADLNIKSRIERGELPGPRIHVTTPYLITSGANAMLDDLGMHRLGSAEDARRVVRYWAEEGAEWIKVYTEISREVFAAVVEAANRHGMKVTGHLCSIGFREAAELGIDNIEHGLRTNAEYDRTKEPDRCPATFLQSAAGVDIGGDDVRATHREMIARGVALTSTAAVNEQLAPGRPLDERALELLAPHLRDEELTRREMLNAPDAVAVIPTAAVEAGMFATVFQKGLQFDREFVRAGGLLAAGIDPAFGALPGLGDQRNLELLVESGFSVPEAVQVMTANGARVLGVLDERGTVTAGKLADLVVIEGDLAADASAIREVRLVFKDGVGYDSRKLIDAVRGQVGTR